MLCSRLLDSTLLCGSSIFAVNSKRPNSVQRNRHHQIAHSSYSQTARTHSTKSEVSMDSVPKTHESAFQFLSKKPYVPPSWAAPLNPVPSHMFSLGHVCFDDLFLCLISFTLHQLNALLKFLSGFFCHSFRLQFTSGTFPICLRAPRFISR